MEKIYDKKFRRKKYMKGNKILTTLVVLAMVLSTMVVLYKLDVKIGAEAAFATMGITNWGYPENVTTANLVYDPDNAVNINVNTTGLTTNSKQYLYYPNYDRSGSTYNMSWKPYRSTGGVHQSITVASPGTDETLSGIYLNRSGLWAFNGTEESGVINGSTAADFLLSSNCSFWVNTSTTYTMTVTPDEVYYGDNATITINVRNADGDLTYCWVDVRQERNGTEVSSFPKEAASPSGISNLTSNYQTRLKYAGNYTVVAWHDTSPQPLYNTIGYGYNSTFGQSPAAVSADWYSYAVCGPWDPPEYNTSYYASKLVVHPGEPTTSIPAANETMYWSFDGEVNISVANYDGTNISALNVVVYNSDDVNVTANLTIDATNANKGYIHISNNTWGKNNTHVFGANGTWYAIIYKDVDGADAIASISDRSAYYEWNTTVYFTVAAAPGVQWKWINDDGNYTGADNDGVIPGIPPIWNQPLNISFQIIGDDHSYYGAGGTVATHGQNITVSGDALYLSSKTVDRLPGAWFDGTSTWYVPLTPTMALNGGELAFTASWSGFGTIAETLTIGGDDLNGTIVTISPTEFIHDENVTLTVTVKGATGYPFPNAQVWLRWVAGDNRTLLNGSAALLEYQNGGGNNNGEYTFVVNRTQQKTNNTAAYGSRKAPRNISAYVRLYRGGSPVYVFGYAITTMKPKTDLKVTMEPNTVMAGQKIKKIYFNTTVVDSAGNTTGYPNDASDLLVRIFNASGTDVTGSIGNLATGSGSKGTDTKANKTATNVYLQKPGTYTVYAYNNTYTSEGNNATLIVKPVDVTSTLTEIIWNVDKNVSATFTVEYNGEPVNGTLRIDNVSTVGTAYNNTWTNCTFRPSIGSTSFTHANSGNTSKSETITNGVVTVYNITANNLNESVNGAWQQYSTKNISFYFKPKSPTGSAWARANGAVPVKIPDVTPSPASIPFDKPATLKVTVTGRGTGLADVFVSIVIPGLTGERNTTTDSNGEATFSFTPPTTGNIIIKIENRTSDTKVLVTSWALYLDAPSQANEGEDFTVTVRNGTAAGPALEGAAVIFNRDTKTTDSSGQATFTASAVTTDREYTILATKEGYAEDTETIAIINVPVLVIVPPSAPPTTGSTFEVVIADDLGNAIIGATVTLNDKTYTSSTQGITTLTAPSEKGDYTITASKTGFKTFSVTITIEEGGIPGFELLTLIAAIGVAFILLRRRRN